MDNNGNENRNVQMSSGDLSAGEDCNNYAAYDLSKASMRKQMARVIEAAEAAYKGHDPVRKLWNQAMASCDDFMTVTHCVMAKEKDSLKMQPGEAEARVKDFLEEVEYFNEMQRKVRKKLKYLKKQDEHDSLRNKEQCKNSNENNNKSKDTKAAVQDQAGLRMASEKLCMQPPGHVGEGQPEAAVQGQARLSMASEKLCMPPRRYWLPETLRKISNYNMRQAALLRTASEELCARMALESCLQAPGRATSGEGQPEAVQYQDGLGTASEELCTPEAAEAAVQCQAGLIMASEAYLLPPGHAGGGQPKAAVQGQGKLCLPLGGDAGNEGRPHLPKAAILCQAGLRMASEKLCTLPPGSAGGGQPEAAVQGQGGLCLPPGVVAGKEGRPHLPKAAVLCQAGLRMASEKLCTLPPGHAGGGQPEAAVQGQDGLCLPPGGNTGKEGRPRLPKAAVLCQAGLMVDSESCLPAPGHTVPGEGQPEAATRGQAGLRMASEMLKPGHAGGRHPETAQYQGGLRTASEESCLPPGCAALSPTVWRRSWLPESLKEVDDRNFFIHNMTQTAYLKAKEEFNNNVRTPSDELCTLEAAEFAVLCQGWLMISESFLPPPGCAAPGEGQPEAAHMGRLMESCLPTLGCAAPGKGQPEASQYQAGLRMASEESCLPTGWACPTRTPLYEWCTLEAGVLCQARLMVASESCLPPGYGALGEAQYQGGLRMAAEKLCMLPPGHAGGGQPKAAQYQGGLRTASEESCLPSGCAALGPAAWRRSRLQEPSREMEDKKFFVYNMMQTAFLKANEKFNNNVRTPLGELRTPKVADLCQGVLLAASESCLLAPGCTAPGEGQPEAATRGQAGLRMAAEKLCMLLPGGGQPEAAQYQGGLRTASEESCLPPGCGALSPTVWRRSRLPESLKEMDDRKFFIHNMTQTAFLKAKEEFNNNVRTPSDELCMPEAAEVAVLCQGWLMISESFLPPPGHAAPGEGQPEAAHVSGLLELCLPNLQHAAPGEGQPEAAQYQGGLRTASEESCLPPGCAAWRRSRLLETSGELDDRKFFVYNMRPLLKAKEECNYNVRTPSDKLCTPEAAVLCQDGLMVASESCLPPGHVGKLCTPEAAKAAVLCQARLIMALEAYLLSPGRAVPGEGQPEAAIKGQPGLRMASERLCMLPPGHAGGGQPEADQYQGRQRTASEETCLPPGCAALDLAAWRRSQLLEKSREMDYRKFFIHKRTQMAFLKAKEEFNNNIGTPSDELCMPEAAEVAVLCQGWLMISESFLPPPGCAAPGEGQPEAAHIIGLLESCLPTLGRASPVEVQPEAAQYQGGLRTASEELCLPTGCVAWRRSRLLGTSGEMDDRKFFIHMLKAKEESNYNVRTPSYELCTLEAAVLCQDGLMVASESCLPPGRVGKLGTPEAAEAAVLCQARLIMALEAYLLSPGRAVRTPLDELCTSEAAVLCQARRIVALESCLPLGRAALGETQYQGRLRMAAEKECMLSPRHAGGGQPEAAQYQGGLRTASEESCLPPRCAALSPTAWRRSQLPETSREMDELYMPEAAVLCQAGLMVASESCLPPGCAALGEAQYQGGLRMAAEKLCMLPPGHAGGGQPEASQYQGGLRMASEESCLPPGCAAPGHAAWRRSRLPSKKKRRRRQTSAGTVGSLSCTAKYGSKPRRGQMTNPGLGGGRCQGRKGPIH
jgi:hypothetical protein